jgi:signal transduction histidine kinase/ligand-binding sensor domain-containing protein
LSARVFPLALAKLKLTRLAILLLSATQIALCLDASKTLTQYAHRIWGQEEGLFQPTIYSVLQTRDGFLWLGTQDSLIRFDGVTFREFEYRDQAVLHGDLIRTLLQDRNGNLWIGSIGAGLARISPEGEFTRFGVAQGLRGVSITNLSQAKDGSIWISTEEGLGRMVDGRVRMFTHVDGLPSDGVRSSCESADGERWIAGRDFPLGKWDGLHFTRVLNETVNTLTCASDGSIWAGSDSGAVRIDSKEFRRFTVRDGLPDNAVSSLLEGPGGSIWVGTNDGVSRYSGGKFSSYGIRDGLSHSLVLSLAFDSEGSLWAGTKNGLDQLADSPVTPFTTNEGLSSNVTSAVAADRAGNLWVGTLDRGLNVFNGEGFRAITQKDGLLDNEVLSLANGPSGDVWAGTRNGITRLVSGAVSATYPLPGEEVRALYADTSGTIWAATNGGLRKFDGNQFRKIDLLSPADDGVVALAGGRTVRLFISLQNDQLIYLQKGRFNTYNFPPGTKPVDCYLVDHEHHNAWMGTLGSSLMRWQNGKISRVRVRDGLYDNRIYSILKDDHDNLWMASSKGIFRVGEKELNEFADGKRSSVLSIPFTTGQLRFECRAGVQPAACKTKDGRLWFSTTTGLVVIDPNHLSVSDSPPPVRITAFIVDGQRVGFRGNVHVKPSERNLEIHYAGLSFVSPEKVAFQYRLGGFSRTWTDAGSRRAAFFTNLPPGEFHFEVRARSAAGIWSREAAALTFTVEPRLSQRPWFLPALGLLLGGMIAAGYRARVRRLRAGFALVTAERSRIARELHDTLLQGLSGVTMQLHALWLGMTPGSKEKRILGSIVRDAGHYSAEARQSLWGLRSRNSQANIFSDRLSELARSMTSSSDIALILEIHPVSVEDRPEAEFQLLRIAREAMVNVLNHSEARHLRVGLSIENDELLLTVKDDGTGFVSERNYQALGHFGLTGMKERAAEIGAVFELESSAHGTCVSVRLPLRRNVPLSKTRQTV